MQGSSAIVNVPCTEHELIETEVWSTVAACDFGFEAVIEVRGAPRNKIQIPTVLPRIPLHDRQLCTYMNWRTEIEANTRGFVGREPQYQSPCAAQHVGVSQGRTIQNRQPQCALTAHTTLRYVPHGCVGGLVSNGADA